MSLVFANAKYRKPGSENTDEICRRIIAYLGCGESYVRLSYQLTAPTADGTGDETTDSKLDVLRDGDQYDSSSAGAASILFQVRGA